MMLTALGYGACYVLLQEDKAAVRQIKARRAKALRIGAKA
jgi:hypothetical protein